MRVKFLNEQENVIPANELKQGETGIIVDSKHPEYKNKVVMKVWEGELVDLIDGNVWDKDCTLMIRRATFELHEMRK